MFFPLEQDFSDLDPALHLHLIFKSSDETEDGGINTWALALAIVSGVVLIMFVFLAIAYYMRVSK